jgi:DNA-directed RNA polymerase subunit H
VFILDEKKLNTKESLKKETVKKPKKTKIVKTRRQRRLKDEIEHNFIPLHTIATESDLAELLLKEISIEKLPLISVSDPAIRQLEVKPNDIIKIVRKNEIIGDVNYYRRVVSDE